MLEWRAAGGPEIFQHNTQDGDRLWLHLRQEEAHSSTALSFIMRNRTEVLFYVT